MATIQLILVRSSCSARELEPFGNGLLTVDLDVDPDNALERICWYFEDKWHARVHALRWIFPEDELIAGADPAACLVLYVDNAGDLTVSESHGSNPPGRGERSCPRVAQLFEAATRPLESQPWSSPGWLGTMFEWAAGAFGRESVRRISQVRVCPNGAVLKVTTDRGAYFMKTLPASYSHEVRLLTLLHELLPGSCPAVLPVRPNDNTHITREIVGRPLRVVDDPAQWKTTLTEIAQLQIGAIPHLDRIKATGIPCQSFWDFAANLGNTLCELTHLQAGAPNELSPRELDKVPHLIRSATSASEILGECALTETLVHGDLNESNIFVGSDVTLIDWTFSRVGHPFVALGFTLFAALARDHRMHRSWEELRGAYLEPWYRYAERRKLVRAIDAAAKLFWIDTALEIARLVRRTQRESPGIAGHLSEVLRRSLSAFGFAD